MIIITITDQHNPAKAVTYQATAVLYMVPIVLNSYDRDHGLQDN